MREALHIDSVHSIYSLHPLLGVLINLDDVESAGPGNFYSLALFLLFDHPTDMHTKHRVGLKPCHNVTRYPVLT